MTTRETKSTNELAEERTDLAARRTLMAADRSLMAWIRTALSMISFGFTIYKLLEEFQNSGAVLPHGDSPRNLGLFLTGLGTLAMVMGTVEYWWTLKALREHETFRLWRASFGIALVMSLLGIFMFFSISLKIL